MDETTTPRVRSSTRDRVRDLGQQTRQSADAVVARAVELYEREMFWASWDRVHAAMPPQEQAEEAAGIAPWDRASAADLLAGEGHDRADG